MYQHFPFNHLPRKFYSIVCIIRWNVIIFVFVVVGWYRRKDIVRWIFCHKKIELIFFVIECGVQWRRMVRKSSWCRRARWNRQVPPSSSTLLSWSCVFHVCCIDLDSLSQSSPRHMPAISAPAEVSGSHASLPRYNTHSFVIVSHWHREGIRLIIIGIICAAIQPRARHTRAKVCRAMPRRRKHSHHRTLHTTTTTTQLHLHLQVMLV